MARARFDNIVGYTKQRDVGAGWCVHVMLACGNIVVVPCKNEGATDKTVAKFDTLFGAITFDNAVKQKERYEARMRELSNDDEVMYVPRSMRTVRKGRASKSVRLARKFKALDQDR